MVKKGVDFPALAAIMTLTALISDNINLELSPTASQDCLDELELDSAEDEAGTRSDGGSGIAKDDFIDTWR